MPQSFMVMMMEMMMSGNTTTSSSLAAKIAAMRAEKQPATLTLFLTIYSKAQHECYIDYMIGAKCLHYWLTYGSSVPLDLEEEKHPRINDPSFIIPSIMTSYELNELSRIVDDTDINTSTSGNRHKVRKAIYLNQLAVAGDLV